MSERIDEIITKIHESALMTALAKGNSKHDAKGRFASGGKGGGASKESGTGEKTGTATASTKTGLSEQRKLSEKHKINYEGIKHLKHKNGDETKVSIQRGSGNKGDHGYTVKFERKMAKGKKFLSGHTAKNLTAKEADEHLGIARGHQIKVSADIANS